MKMELILLTVTVALAIADTKLSVLSKPKLSNENKMAGFLPKSPEERRTLSLFPKNTQRFVVTPHPFLKKNTSLPKKPALMKIALKETLRNPIGNDSNSRKFQDHKATKTPSIKPRDFLVSLPIRPTLPSGSHRKGDRLNYNNDTRIVDVKRSQDDEYVLANEETERRKFNKEEEIDESIESHEETETYPDLVAEPSVIKMEVVIENFDNEDGKVETTTVELLAHQERHETEKTSKDLAELKKDVEEYLFIRNKEDTKFGDKTSEIFSEDDSYLK